ncbi:zinc-dependent metalloprotease [Allomuricauda sp. F6463D]|uniref:zinc-dependent metalloprotease n=1 Tax=Allomuricauda sp. F6463D TaxID=2926409 RepID=UPI001FF4F486|nr:zinc-dependent metalloprotease [Muricauda sp. F6463D]MCK0159047.1 zinc-dependent metalloprotease [Muricauda sp. F6463D]
MKQLIFYILGIMPFLGLAREPNLHLSENYVGNVPREGSSFLTTTVHNDQLFLTIPDNLLETPMLFVRYDHVPTPKYLQVVWSLQGNNILLKIPRIESTAGILLPVRKRLAQKDNIIGIYPVEQTVEAVNGHTINVTELLLSQAIEWKPGYTETPVPQISLVLGAKNWDNEVVIKVRKGLVMDKSRIAVPIFYGFAALPSPMKSRRFDYRMGFFDDAIDQIHFDLINKKANITRWRLEKKFKDQEVSVPVEPITFWISPEVPKPWRPYIKAGIAEWLPAFESAGFKDALVVKELDSLDPWQAHRIHFNRVHWSQKKYLRGSEEENYGGTIGPVIDIRTGEILRNDIFMGASARTVMEKYFVRAAPLDQRAQRFPFPETLTGQLFQVIAAHEAGHAFGLVDGNFGEFAYPWDKMNDSIWLHKMGHTPSIMNYSRSSNIPQPSDSIPPSLLLQRVGPTDHYNIQWAYTEFPKGTTKKAEAEALEQMVRWQDSVPWYRFNSKRLEVIGPAASNEVVETNNPVQSTQLALKNLERVMALLPAACHDQNDNARLERLYERTGLLWLDHMKHVLSLVGGYDIHYKSIDQPGPMYDPLDREMQEEALHFLLSNAFDPPKWLNEPSFHTRTRFSTFSDKILDYQRTLLFELLSANRLKRLEYMESFWGYENLVVTFLSQLRSGLFQELRSNTFPVNARRQELQQLYIGVVIRILEKEGPSIDPQEQFFIHSDYAKGLLKQQLMELKKEIKSTLKRNKKGPNGGHWQLCLRKISAME